LSADGITYAVTGGGSVSLYEAGLLLPESQAFSRRTHFVLLEIDAGTIQVSAIDLNGDVFDQAEVPVYSFVREAGTIPMP